MIHTRRPAKFATDNLASELSKHNYTFAGTVSFVIPNLAHDIHDGTVQVAEEWLKSCAASRSRI